MVRERVAGWGMQRMEGAAKGWLGWVAAREGERVVAKVRGLQGIGVVGGGC